MVRTFRGVLVLLALGAVVGAGAAFAGDDKPCVIATPAKSKSPVAEACAKGGLIEAKKVMKDLVKKGRAAGKKFECDDCHKNDTGYDLTPQGRDNFQALLAAIDAKK